MFHAWLGRARHTIKKLGFFGHCDLFCFALPKGLFPAIEVVLHVGQRFYKKCCPASVYRCIQARQRLD
jgi:hypothetical protein